MKTKLVRVHFGLHLPPPSLSPRRFGSKGGGFSRFKPKPLLNPFGEALPLILLLVVNGIHEGIFLPNNIDVRADIQVPVVFHRLLAFVFAAIVKS